MDNHTFLLGQVRRSLAEYDRILLALSGGVDSVVLLHLLTELRRERPELTLRAVYIHHGLSGNAARWQEHCRIICQRWQVDFDSVNVTVSAQKTGIEAGARQARYQVLRRYLLPKEVLLTAQHLDDQCETFFLALKRGSGPAGLSAMPVNRPFADTRQIRPLLNVSRQQIERYALSRDLSWVEDESNFDERYDRNFLRISALPILQRRWPDFARSVARSAELCAEQEQLLDELLAPELDAITETDGALSIPPLIKMSQVKRNALLRRWFEHNDVSMPSRDRLQILWNEVVLARRDAEPQLTLGDRSVRRFRQALYLLKPMQDLSGIALDWNGKDELTLPDGLGNLSALYGAQATDFALRPLEKNERISVRFGTVRGNVSIQGREGSRAIKKLWQEFNVPPWQRTRVPLIYFNDTLIAAVGLFVTQDGAATDQTRRWSAVLK